MTRRYNCKPPPPAPDPASPGGFGRTCLSSGVPGGKHKGRRPPPGGSRRARGRDAVAAVLSGDWTLSAAGGGLPSPPHPRSIASPVSPTSRCRVRSWQGLRLFGRSLGCLDERRNAPTTGNGTSGVPTRGQQEQRSLPEHGCNFSVVGSAFPPRQSSAECFKLGCLRGGKNRLAKFFIQTYLMFLPALPLPDFLVLRKQLPLAF